MLEAVQRDGSEPGHAPYSMTGLLQEALEISDESSFSGSESACAQVFRTAR